MFKKAVSGNLAGRKPGTTTTRVRLMRELAEMIVTHPGVQEKLLEQALAGTLNPRIMVELFRYHGGKPPERVEVSTPNTGRAELVAQLRKLSQEDRLTYAALARKLIAAGESSQAGSRVADLTT